MRTFPSGTKAELLDSFARQSLWEAGLDYRHGNFNSKYKINNLIDIFSQGTGHGVGALLNVHELPIITYRKSSEIGVKENMIITNEPGYYEDGKFGIRIENCMLTIKVNTPYCYAPGVEFLQFEPLTLVPIQREFIDVNLLSNEELKWLNNYHSKCAEIVGPELEKLNKLKVRDWLLEQTKPLMKSN